MDDLFTFLQGCSPKSYVSAPSNVSAPVSNVSRVTESVPDGVSNVTANVTEPVSKPVSNVTANVTEHSNVMSNVMEHSNVMAKPISNVTANVTEPISNATVVTANVTERYERILLTNRERQRRWRERHRKAKKSAIGFLTETDVQEFRHIIDEMKQIASEQDEHSTNRLT